MNALIIGPMPLSRHEAALLASREWDYVVAVDGGVVQCAERGVRPSILVGDLDSIPVGVDPRDYGCLIDEHPAAKDYSDLDAAVAHLATLQLSAVTAVGLAGGRLDHQLVVLRALFNLRESFSPRNVDVTLHGTGETIQFLVNGDCAVVEPSRVFSVIPLFGSASISISGARWNLTEATVGALSAHGLSNESGNDGASVRVTGDGAVLLITQIDG